MKSLMKFKIPAVLNIVVLSLLAAAFSPLCGAQDQPANQAPVAPVEIDPGPEDALNRGTPRGSIVGFLDACSVFDFEKAAQFLDLRNLPDEVEELGGHELARELNHVLSRAVWLDDYTVSDRPEGVKGDGLPDYRDELVVIQSQTGEVPLWMQRVPRGDGEFIWKVSNRSVAQIPELYDEFSYPPGVDTIRGWFPENAAFLGFEIFKWFILAAVALICWPILYLAGLLLSRLFSSPSSPTYSLWRKVLTGPIVAVGILVVLTQFVRELGMTARAQEIADAQTLNTAVIVWFFWSVTNLVKIHQQQKLNAQGRPGAAKLMQPMTTFIKLVILLFGLLYWLNNLGVNISTLLAGLGVGGLALALALQKPIEDMMGALTLFTQAPVKVGDFCRYGEITGTIEDIGLRSTRIRTLTNTLVHVPNARIAHVEIENFTSRTMIRFWPTLRLRYDTTPAQLRQVLAGILDMLERHDRVHEEPLRVRFTDFDEDAILVKINSFMRTTDFPESLEIAEDLNFRIMEIVHAAGAEFALPGKSIYMEDGYPADSVGSAAAT
jgi:MscS family membrane protein